MGVGKEFLKDVFNLLFWSLCHTGSLSMALLQHVRGQGVGGQPSRRQAPGPQQHRVPLPRGPGQEWVSIDRHKVIPGGRQSPSHKYSTHEDKGTATAHRTGSDGLGVWPVVKSGL